MVIVLMRVRFVFTPISSDEGGYLAIGRAWGRGAVLYRDVWVDRPQGLLVVFRALSAVGLGTPEGVRLLAIVACLMAAVACGTVAATLVGPRAAGIAALLVGVLASVPQYEGFIANAELLSCSVGAVALALVVRAVWGRDRPALRGLVLAGVVGGCAVSLKQSGFDAVAAGVLAVLLSSSGGRWSGQDRRRAVAALSGGLLVVLALMALHGALTGWHRWWYAIVGYRVDQRSALTHASWGRLGQTFRVVAPALVPVVIVIVVLAAVEVRGPERRAAAVLAAWTGCAVVAFLVGGQFFRHYWVILTFPLGTVAGALVSRVTRRVVYGRLLGALLISPAVMTVQAVRIPRAQVGPRLEDDVRFPRDEHIAAWFRAHSMPGDEIYALCAGPGLYGNITADPPYPYLWFDGVRSVPGAADLLVAMLSGPDAPRFVAGYQSPDRCDPSGLTEEALSVSYRSVDAVEGIPIYERRGRG